MEKLTVTNNDYPRAYFFRGAENTYSPYEAWEQNFERLMGIEGKCLNEEKSDMADPNIKYFSKFKKNHPHKMVLLHFNGNARSPRFDMEGFFAGHFVYFNGAKILSQVPAESGITAIEVSDASLFREDVGRAKEQYGKISDDIGLCELDENREPNWHKSEQVKLVSVDKENDIIRVRRGHVGTEPRAFEPEESYAAAHVVEGPWGGEGLMWFYNYSTKCPDNKDGKKCVDVLVEDISERFLSGGELEAFDGIQFDVSFKGLKNHSYLWNYEKRRPDANADGKLDDGFINGVNTYGQGVHKFYKELRKKLGNDRLILADGMTAKHQRELGVVNGIESEGWPIGDDFNIQNWSSGLNRMLFWDKECKEPAMSYINHRWWIRDYSDIHINTQRLVIAASVLTNSAYALADSPSRILGYSPETDKNGHSIMPLWDELVKGKANEMGWLGEPIGPTVRMAEKEEETLKVTSSNDLNKLKSRIQGKVNLSVKDGEMRVTPRDSNAKQVKFTIEDISCDGPELLVLLTMSGRSMENAPSNWPRLMHAKVPQQEEGQNRFMSWVNNKDFQSDFYFTHISSSQVDLGIKIESSELVRISGIHAYAHPDAMYRKFENGIVLANPSPRPYEFNLAELFSGQSFRRIEGSRNQDPETNDGSVVKSNKIKLQGKDALFLIKE